MASAFVNVEAVVVIIKHLFVIYVYSHYIAIDIVPGTDNIVRFGIMDSFYLWFPSEKEMA